MLPSPSAPRPPSCRLLVWVSPSSRSQIHLARALDEAFGSAHSRSPTITGSTNNDSNERTRSSDLDSLRAQGTPPWPRSLLAACCLGGKNGTRTHKEQMINRERRVQEKRETLLTRISNGEQSL